MPSHCTAPPCHQSRATSSSKASAAHFSEKWKSMDTLENVQHLSLSAVGCPHGKLLSSPCKFVQPCFKYVASIQRSGLSSLTRKAVTFTYMQESCVGDACLRGTRSNGSHV